VQIRSQLPGREEAKVTSSHPSKGHGTRKRQPEFHRLDPDAMGEWGMGATVDRGCVVVFKSIKRTFSPVFGQHASASFSLKDDPPVKSRCISLRSPRSSSQLCPWPLPRPPAARAMARARDSTSTPRRLVSSTLVLLLTLPVSVRELLMSSSTPSTTRSCGSRVSSARPLLPTVKR
jgi:hypothetical protein